jgi:DNA-binding SARP family transcriptional activator
VLRVCLLGSVTLEASGRSAPVSGDPAKKALAWLALRPNEFTDRQRVAEILWPGGRRESTLNSLGRGLSALRAAITALGLEAHDHLRIGPPMRSQIGLFDVSTDVGEFRALRDTGALSDALALLRGKPMADIGPTAGLWIETTQAELADEVDDVLNALGESASASGDDAEALRLNERRLALQADNEDALCQAALSMQRVGRTTNALALIDRFQLETSTLAPDTLELKQFLQTRSRPSPDGRPAFARPPAPPARYAPTHSYDATSTFDPSFNRDLSADLSRSHTYTFRGISAKYVPARLLHRGPGLDIVRVMMLDPGAHEAIRLRAVDRKQNPKYHDADVPTIASTLREEILRSLVGLFDARALCTIDIALIASTAVDRVELFDDSVYVSLYHGPRSLCQPFPETMRYTRETVAYGHHRLDCLRQLDLARHRLQFRPEADDADLLPQLAQTGADVTAADIAVLRDEAHTFAHAFLAELQTVTAPSDNGAL